MNHLTKTAKFREAIYDILKNYNEAHDEIEQPIQDMHAGFDNLEEAYSVDNNGVTIARALGAPTWHKFAVEDNMRKVLKTDERHKENSKDAARRILQLGNVEVSELSPYQSERVISDFKRIGPELNGLRGLKGFGTVGAAVASGVLGGIAANRVTPGMGMVGAIGGGIVGGSLGYMGLGKLMNNSIQARDHEIYNTQEHTYQRAYDRLRARYE